ncbi:MAG TPA: hypothetical protein PKA16_14715 [Ottowia sp.]|uniref:hypothetical protein n=1 Tax=Ottowia sp. TaxID=1898956 RepID=UPI002D0BB9E4|nr:hypothetical protein [Ottowia sp.]HMN22629.1 hypothetical protein [Ottowia sp.]
MNTVYGLSPKGQREYAAQHPVLPGQLRALLRMIDGRRTRDEVLTLAGKNVLTVGGLRWLRASGYIVRVKSAVCGGRGPAETRADALSRWTDVGPATSIFGGAVLDEAGVCSVLSDFLLRSIRRHLGENGYPGRAQISQATDVRTLLPHLGPLLDAILERAGPEVAAEFADTTAVMLRPLER